MAFSTGLLFNYYSMIPSIVRILGPLPVFDLVLWTIRRVKRRRKLFVAGLILGGCLVLGLSSAFAL